MSRRRYARDAALLPSREGLTGGMAATEPLVVSRAVVSAGADDDAASRPVEPTLDSPDGSDAITAAMAGGIAAEVRATARAVLW